MHSGEKIRELSEKKVFLQRQLAASREIDTPMYSKIERGERKAKREQVVLLSKLLNFKEDELLTIWLADQVLDIKKMKHWHPKCSKPLKYKSTGIQKTTHADD